MAEFIKPIGTSNLTEMVGTMAQKYVDKVPLQNIKGSCED